MALDASLFEADPITQREDISFPFFVAQEAIRKFPVGRVVEVSGNEARSLRKEWMKIIHDRVNDIASTRKGHNPDGQRVLAS